MISNIKQQLNFHFQYSRSAYYWFMIFYVLLYAFGMILNFTSDNSFFGSGVFDDHGKTITSYTPTFCYMTVIFIFINGIKDFNGKFLGAMGFRASRKSFYLGLVSYSFISTIILTAFNFVFILLDQLLLPMINGRTIELYTTLSFLQNGYIIQIIFWFGLFLFISSLANFIGCLRYLFGNVIVFVVLILFFFLPMFNFAGYLSKIFSMLLDLLTSYDIYIQTLKLVGYSIILMGIQWFIIRTLEIQLIKSLKKTANMLLVVFIGIILLITFGVGVEKTASPTGDSITFTTIDQNALSEYSNTYLGDNSKVYQILQQLPGNNYLDSIELGTSEKPYSLTVIYDDDRIIENENFSHFYSPIDDMLEKNAAILFTLISNVDQISLQYGTPNSNIGGIIFNRSALKQKYSFDLDMILNQ